MVETALGAALQTGGGNSLDDLLVLEPAALVETTISAAVGRTFFGDDAEAVMPSVRALLDELSTLIGNPLAPPASWRTPLRRRIEMGHLALTHTVAALLRDRSHRPSNDVCTEVATHPRAPRYAMAVKAEMLVGALLASQRVPAAAGAWMLHLLATHPRWQRAIDTTREDAAHRQESAPSVSRAVALEALRLYPATWLLQRTTHRELQVGGYVFPANHHFLMSPYAVQRDARTFADPESFQPGRWLSGEAGTRPQAGFLAFGDGEHICPGRHLAVEALATIAQRVTQDYVLSETSRQVSPECRTTLLPLGSRIRFVPKATFSENRQSSRSPRFASGQGSVRVG